MRRLWNLCSVLIGSTSACPPPTFLIPARRRRQPGPPADPKELSGHQPESLPSPTFYERP
eukprot:2754041-Pyramimonas_sp.AAC.1